MRRGGGGGSGANVLVVTLVTVVLLVSGCAPGSVPTELAAPSPTSAAGPPPVTPAGSVVVAYPEEPAAWHPAWFGDAAAIDLAATWGLPLFHLDAAGQLRPALARSWAVGSDDASWWVDVSLRPGEWSDGAAVVAGDVVATVDALRTSRHAAEFAAVTEAVAVAADTVRLRFAAPYPRWPHLLAGGRSVLPAHVLAASGFAAYRGLPPVTGGAFEIEEHDPGRHLRLRARPASPLGPTRLASVEIVFTPSYETALGLLADGRVDVALGYLALNAVQRAEALAGVEAAAPLGGTWVGVWWRDGGAYGGSGIGARERRARVRDGLSLDELIEGLLGGAAEPATGLIPGIDGPWDDPSLATSLDSDPVPQLLIPKWQEALAFSARALQRALRVRGGSAELVRLEPDELARVRGGQGDGAVVVVRDGPRPALVEHLREGVDAAVIDLADRAATARAPEVDGAQRALHADASILPLYRIGVAHAWTSRVVGIAPSSYPGLALWDLPGWSVDEP